MRIGYIRVSTVLQNTDRQLEGESLDKTFTDKLSGKDTARPALREMLQFAREGDIVIVHSLDRLARNLDDLRRIVKNLTGRGVTVRFLKENLVFTGEDSPMANLLLSVMGAFAEFERELIKERQREGVQVAKAKGKYLGRKRSVTDDQIEEIKKKIAGGVPKAQIAREVGISRETLYQYIRT